MLNQNSSFVIRHSSYRLTGLLLFLCLPLLRVWSSAVEVGDRSHPFYNLRDRTFDLVEADRIAAADLPDIPIAWFGPTNRDHPLDGDLWRAVNMAVCEANAEGGLNGKSFRLIERWSDSPWQSGVSALFRAVYDEPVVAILGGMDGPTTHLAEQVVAKARLPLVSPVSSDKSVNLAGVPWMFSCAPSDTAIARALAEAVAAEARTNQGPLVLLTATDHDSRLFAKELFMTFAEWKVIVALKLDVAAGATDFEPQLSRLADRPPVMVVIVAGADDTARWVKALRKRFPATVLFGSHRAGRTRFLELAGTAAENLRLPLLFEPNRSAPVPRRFIEAFERQSGHQPDYAAALTYDAARLLIAAIRRAGPDRARIREELVKLSPWSGIAGPIQFDGTGQNTRTNVPMGRFHDSSIVPCDHEPGRNGFHSVPVTPTKDGDRLESVPTRSERR